VDVGDDEKLRIWDINAKRSHQVISDELERWGQVTCVKWLPGISNNGEVLCFGTGRGLVLIYHWLKEAVCIYNKVEARNILTIEQNSFKELSNTSVLPFNEPVESMDYDKNKSRLALSSHTGKIKVFHLEKNGINYLP
jgi:WD40 repeat protein